MENGLKKRVSNTAFTFRGYNITNLGRTPELLAHPDYGPVVRRYLDDASRICTQTTGRKVNLLGRVHRKAKTTLNTYAQDICLIVAVELAQLQILKDMFDISIADAKLVLGYSLGELTALVATGVYSFEAVIAPILASGGRGRVARQRRDAWASFFPAGRRWATTRSRSSACRSPTRATGRSRSPRFSRPTRAC